MLLLYYWYKKKIINISKTLLGDILHQHAYAVSFTAWTFVQIVCGYTSLMEKKKEIYLTQHSIYK